MSSTSNSIIDNSSSSSPRFLTVDETKRPRANSDPVALHLVLTNLPQIKVTDDDDLDTNKDSKSSDHEVESLLGPPLSPQQRQRSNTCPEDMFKPCKKDRPPTPPPSDIMKSPCGKKKFCFNFNPKELNGISFTHHRLCKVSEDGGVLVTKPNQSSRPSQVARRASCLAALSESSSIGEGASEEDSLELSPALRLGDKTISHFRHRRLSDSYGIGVNPALAPLSIAIDKDGLKTVHSGNGNINNVSTTSQNTLASCAKTHDADDVASASADVTDIPRTANIVNTHYSKEHSRKTGDQPSLQAY